MYKEIIEPRSKLTLGIKELIKFSELFYFFTWRDIKVKYKQTALGLLWAILQPFLLMVVFSVFFGKALNVPSDNIPYPIFVFSGLMLWTVFSSGLSNAANSMVNNANIIKKIYFPRLIIPLSAILVALFDFIMAFVVYIGLLVYYQYSVSWTILLFLPLSLLITVFSAFGLGSFLAALNIKYRDFRYVIPYLIQVLLFVTPVIYPVSIFNNNWAQKLLLLNPMTGAIELIRYSISGQPLNLVTIAISVFVSLFLLAFGLYYFRKTEYYFADLA
jgi:lipopolysaccharide transport system permease protein